MKNYTIDESLKWDYENGFYLTSEINRIGKLISHYEIYNLIASVDGDILEFGVYKGASIARLLTFRNLLESENGRKVYGFDIFGKFPNNLELKSDRDFVEDFERQGGFGIEKEELERHLSTKGFVNFELIKGDIFSTIPEFLTSHEAINVSLIHIDVDVYEPTKLILESFWDKLAIGGILMLDDYNVIEGETKAVNEFFQGKSIAIEKAKYNKTPYYIIKDK